MYRVRASVLVLAALTLLLAACGGGGNVQSVEIDGGALRLAEGDTATLTANVRTTGAVSDEVEWSSSDEAIATVDTDGVVTAIQAGSAEITAISVADERRSDAVSVTVLDLPTGAAEVPGGATAIVGSEEVTASTDVSGGNFIVTVGDAELQLQLLAGDGEALPVAPGGAPRVTADGSVSIQGGGYAPGSPVDVWLFSEPAFLGSVAVDSTGGFEASYALPTGLEAGLHTLIVEGLNQDDETLTLRVGIEVEEGAAITEFAHCPANADWYVSSERGDDEALGSTISSPFATIQVAIQEAADADVVCVAAGTYTEGYTKRDDGVIVFASVDKPLTLVGPNVGVEGSGYRGPEAEIIVSNPADAQWYAFRVNSSDVAIEGFYFGTETPKRDPLPGRGGDGGYGIWVGTGATAGVSVRDNHVVDMNFPIWVNRGTTAEAASGFVIENNLVEGSRAASDQGIMVQGAAAEVRDNVIRDARVGLQIQPYHYGGGGVVEGNDIEAFQAGLWFNGEQHADATWEFTNNAVVGAPSPWDWPLYNSPDNNMWSGIRIEAFRNGAVSFEGNRIEAGGADTPTGEVYLLRQRIVTGGTVLGIGTFEELGEFFTSNVFPDFGAEGVSRADLSDVDGLIQLMAPTE